MAWCKISIPEFRSVREMVEFAAKWGNCPKKKETFISICYGALWKIWKARNEQIFKKKRKCPTIIAQETISLVYEWCKHRGKIIDFGWDKWCIYPM